MSTEHWNDDIAYTFSAHRIFLRIYGLWPLQAQTLFTRIRWSFCIIAQLMVLPFVTLDLMWSNENADTGIESILYFVSAVLGIIKQLCIAVNQKKLGININAAIDDWLSAKDDEETRKIMKKYAIKARILTFILLYSACGCFCIYVSAIAFINLKQIFFTDSLDANANTTNWILLVPSGPLGKSITGSQYVIILLIQIVQTSIICSTQCIIDSFFFNVTMHLSGQLEVLKNRFKIFLSKPDTEANYRKKFVGLINRHSELMEFYQNLEDSFHFFILSQLVMVTIMLALIGLRINLCLNEKNHVEMAKSVLVLNYLLTESLVLTYGGDFLQRESEGIFYALYTTSWFTLPLALMKDLHFVMMRSNIPFRLTGGKFFYVNRETMMYILKTAVSYVSVLRIALKE
ncbi:odorant receptor 13a-like [Polyergus mexicanus]|uniref:odorant receptor 13a-like n=1 Tax=Polyergus mexicanus TaxID=615972 RepID=UPI0038B618F4